MNLTVTAHLLDAIHAVLIRYFERGERQDDTVLTSLNSVGIAAKPRWIKRMLDCKEPFDDDFYMFRAFSEHTDVILDIGGNWGYSAGAIWSVGSNCRVVTFEPMQLHSRCLDEIARLRPNQFKYRLFGLADYRAAIRFVVPVIGGFAISALASANPRPDLQSLASHIHDYVFRWMHPRASAGDSLTFHLCEFEAPVQSLDVALKLDQGLLDNLPIVGMKIDVEGLEFRVLKGAYKTLSLHKPLIMVEGGNRWNGVPEYMSELGYLYAERKGMELRPVTGLGVQCNGFFVHRDKIDRYRNMGIYSL